MSESRDEEYNHNNKSNMIDSIEIEKDAKSIERENEVNGDAQDDLKDYAKKIIDEPDELELEYQSDDSIENNLNKNNTTKANIVSLSKRNNDNDEDIKSITNSFAQISIKNKSMEDQESSKSS